MRLVRVLGALSVMGFAATSSQFAAAADSEWYGGIGVGQSRAKIDDPRIISGLLSSGYTTTSITDDDRDTGYKLFGGYKFNKNFALEGGYFDLGKFSFVATTVPPGTLTGQIKLRGINLDALGILPITNNFSAFGRVGVHYTEARDTFSGTGAVVVTNPRPSKKEANLKVGVGVQYDVTPSLGLRAEAERYRINDAVGNRGDIDVYSLGLLYRFGGSKPAPAPRAEVREPVRVVAAPPPVVVEPAPAPVMVPAPMPERVTFSTDSLFSFNKSTVNHAGKHDLDKFAQDLKGTHFHQISITGHTDRLGSDAYNMRLSNRRAEAVKAYLVDPAGIDASKIVTNGKGETEPVTKPGECKGNKPTKKLVACLQPDRRVEVEVAGTK